jgi:uncharacterized protein YbjT (DUF2867 family)
MKIVIIGGTGLIGSKVVQRLTALGHEAVPAAPNTGVNTLTGEGLDDALSGARVVVDVSNSPSFEDAAVMAFFQTSTRNILAAESKAGVRHHVMLSVVGSGRLPYSGYMRAKVAQEKLVSESSIPYSIVHATQFFEFMGRIADSATEGDTVRVPPVLFQPMAADDVASAVVAVAVGQPIDGVVEVAGPEQFRFDEVVREVLAERHDPRKVVADPQATYFGSLLAERSLVPFDDARLGKTTLRQWLDRSAVQAAAAKQASGQAAVAGTDEARGTTAASPSTQAVPAQNGQSPEWASEPGASADGMRIRRPSSGMDGQAQQRVP